MLKVAGGAGLQASLASVGLLGTTDANAQLPAGFQAKTLADALRALGAAASTDSADIRIDAPDVAENGAAVPITVRSNLPQTEAIALLVEKNPQPLASLYEVLAGLEPEVGSRIKMNETSDVYVLVRAGGKHYVARKQIRVILGGCMS